MRALFDYGYQLGRKGHPWRKTPPGLTAARNPNFTQGTRKPN
jgi:hypothetical protein